MATMIRCGCMLVFLAVSAIATFCMEHPGMALLIFAVLFGGGACAWSLWAKIKEMKAKQDIRENNEHSSKKH